MYRDIWFISLINKYIKRFKKLVLNIFNKNIMPNLNY